MGESKSMCLLGKPVSDAGVLAMSLMPSLAMVKADIAHFGFVPTSDISTFSSSAGAWR
jgi:hypothetical protein